MLVSCFCTGAPWSEQPLGTEFGAYMKEAFNYEFRGSYVTESQDREFCCGHPLRNGVNALLKNSKACDVEVPFAEQSRVLIAVRQIVSYVANTDLIWGDASSPSRFWLAMKVDESFSIPPFLGNDRSSLLRRRPHELSQVLSQATLNSLKVNIQRAIAWHKNEIQKDPIRLKTKQRRSM